MKINSDRITRFQSSIKASKRARAAQQFRAAYEPLESRLLLSAALSSKTTLPPAKSPLPDFMGPVRPDQVVTASTGKGGTTSAAAPAHTPAVGVSVGSVVNISAASGNQTEADIAINPTNPNAIFAVSNVSSGSFLFTSRSTDGGVNWTKNASAFSGACCDARTIYDKFGNLYVVYLNSSASNVIIARSVNDGASFTTILSRSGSWDNPGIAAGADGQVWIEVRSSSGPAGIGFRATGLGTIDTTLGTAGFTATQQVTGVSSTFNYGDVTILNTGAVLLTWTNSGGEGPVTNGVARDPDGIFGATGFGSAIFSYTTNVGGFDYIPAQSGRSVDSEPNFAVAPAGSPFAGRVYMVYADEVTNESNNHDIEERYSDNSGTTWSAPVRVNNDATTRSQLLPQIAVDPTTGAIICSWHDARNDTGVAGSGGTNSTQNDDAQFYGGLSTDGGVTFTNFLIDPGFSNAVAANNGIDFGDWTGSDFYNGHFFAVWASNASNMSPAIVNSPKFELVTSNVTISGVSATAGISGSTFDDLNGNGARDPGEPALDGVTVYIDADNSGTLNAGDTSVVSSVGGLYSFDTLAPGTYHIRAVTPPGRRLTFPASGTYTINLSETSVPGNDFGFVNPRLSGTVYEDTNDNGAIDGSESGKSGVTVYLDLDSSGTLSGGDVSTTTDAGGNYALGGLANGTYTVRIVNPAGYRLTFPGAGAYTQTISNATTVYSTDDFAVTNRVQLNGFVYNDNNGNGSKDGGETGIAGVRVYQDTNNDGIWDSMGSNASSTDVPKAIVDSAITNSTLNVSGAGNINSVTVTLNITHTFDGDLVLTLISPQGTQILLVNRRGGSGDNFTNTTFDDTAGSSVIGGVSPFSGSYQPEVALATLAGENANGIWTLKVDDQASGDTGTINSWSITLGTSEPSVLTAADGSYSFTGLTAGSYNIRQESIANYLFTNPATGGLVVSPSSGTISSNDFGNFLTAYTGSQFYLRLDGSGNNVQVWIDDGSAPASTPTWSAAASLVSATNLSFTGGVTDDSLTVDTSNGNPVPAAGASFFAGVHAAGGDTLIILGKSATAEAFVFNLGSATIDGRTITESSIDNVKFDGKGGNDTLAVNGGPVVQITGTQHLASLSIANAASAHVLPRSNGGKKVIVTNALSLVGTATLDLDDNDMILNYTGGTQLGTVVAAIKLGRDGGLWDGSGITSTAAKNRPNGNTTLGAIESTDYTISPTFNGETVAPGAVYVKYTYYGDANFNGKVDGGDYGRIDFGFTTQGTGSIGGWINGDFNYNDKIEGSDYGLIDFAFTTQAEIIT